MKTTRRDFLTVAGVAATSVWGGIPRVNAEKIPEKIMEKSETMKTIRLLYPDYLSGGLETYYWGAQLLAHLLPANANQPTTLATAYFDRSTFVAS